MSDQINRRAFLGMGYGMYIVSASAEGKKNGQIANTVFQVSNDPPKIVTAISKNNLTHEYIKKARHFSVTVLEQDTPMIFIGTFGFRSGRVIDKFQEAEFIEGDSGAPIVTTHATAYIDTKLTDEVDVGTHTLFIGEVVKAKMLNDNTPLTYRYYREDIKGKTPIDSPTHIPE